MMMSRLWVPDGFYRLVKWREDGNPIFPSADTVVEVKDGEIFNLSTGRSLPISALGVERSLFGPLASPYDSTQLKHLKRINLVRAPGAGKDVTVPRH